MKTTLITSLYDIGRNNWEHWNRTQEQYFKYLGNILSLNSNIVVFIDEADLERVTNLRKTYDPELKYIKIITRKFNDMECYKIFFEKTKEVMQSEKFISRIKQKDTPEMKFPEYNIVNFNKIFLVNEVIESNPFNSEYFMWIDAGFYHHMFPKEYIGRVFPDKDKVRNLDDNRVHFLSLVPEEYIKINSYMDPTVTITGSWFAGKADPLKKLKPLVIKVIQEFLDSNAANDDQAIYAGCYMYSPDLFTIEVGDWFKSLDYYITS